MKTKEKEVKAEENGHKKVNAAPEPIKIVLSVKQRELLKKTVVERQELEVMLKVVQQKEADLTALILDTKDLDNDKVASMEIDDNFTTLTIVKKE